jgi:hypothetical protein
MNSIKIGTHHPGRLLLGALLAAIPLVAGAGEGQRLGSHEWPIEGDPGVGAYQGTSLSVGPDVFQNWPIEGDPAVGTYQGTSLSVGSESELGFADPRPGDY